MEPFIRGDRDTLMIRAAQASKIWHHGQVRKYTGEPYYFHPARVAARFMPHPLANSESVAAAFLHDVVEDTEISLEEIEFYFEGLVASYVNELTNPSRGSKLPRADRKKMDREHLANVSQRAKLIKLYDRIDNVNDMSGAPYDFKKLYAQESILLLDVIGHADSDLYAELNLAVEKMMKGI